MDLAGCIGVLKVQKSQKWHWYWKILMFKFFLHNYWLEFSHRGFNLQFFFYLLRKFLIFAHVTHFSWQAKMHAEEWFCDCCFFDVLLYNFLKLVLFLQGLFRQLSICCMFDQSVIQPFGRNYSSATTLLAIALTRKINNAESHNI